MDRPKSIEKWSPNFTPKDPGRDITCVVIHATATKSKESALEWLCDAASKVSAHYLIDEFGGIWHLVHEQNEAWHAGESYWNGKPYVNGFSVGIELVNPNDGTTEYPEPQLQSCAQLVCVICIDHAIGLGNIIGHKDIAPGRKTDPAGFPWDRFKQILNTMGVS